MPHFTATEIGAALRAAREYRGLTYKQAGEELGLPPGTVACYESPYVRPSRESIERLTNWILRRPIRPVTSTAT